MKQDHAAPQEGAPVPPRVNGKLLTYAVFLLLLVSATFTYYGVPQFVIPYYTAKPGQTERVFASLEQAIQSYYIDHGTFPPQEPMIWHRRINKNIGKSRALGINAPSLRSLTTPVVYIDYREAADPYALPEQYTPPAFMVLEQFDRPTAIIYSPGQNLIYDVKPIVLRPLSQKEALLYIEANRYDPTNGTRSGGDLIQFIRIKDPSPVAP